MLRLLKYCKTCHQQNHVFYFQERPTTANKGYGGNYYKSKRSKWSM